MKVRFVTDPRVAFFRYITCSDWSSGRALRKGILTIKTGSQCHNNITSIDSPRSKLPRHFLSRDHLPSEKVSENRAEKVTFPSREASNVMLSGQPDICIQKKKKNSTAPLFHSRGRLRSMLMIPERHRHFARFRQIFDTENLE